MTAQPPRTALTGAILRRGLSIVGLVVMLAAALAHGLGPAAVRAAEGDAAVAEAAEDSGGIINGATVFFGCAVGAAVGAIATAFPPLVGWTMVAGALPAMAAVAVTSGIGCSVGLFGGVLVATIVWVFDAIGRLFGWLF